jgi:1-acyl-sn-glycerol-3-phosphate acyltransferase
MLRVFAPRDVAAAVGHGAAALAGRVLGTRDVDATTAPTDRDPAALGEFFAGVRWLARHYFRARLEGLEHVPAHGPALLVGNHSGGLVAVDWALTSLAVWDAHGPGRAVYGLGHDILMWSPVTRKYAGRFGALRAGHGAARAAFANGDLVLVYPGSEYDSFRPFSKRDRVVLAGRTGFLRLAIGAGVPIIPVVTAGAQEQYVLLTSGERLARALDLPRILRSNVCPIGFSLPWGLTSGLLPYLPLPTQITVAFCPPIHLDAPPAAADDPAVLARAYADVERVMQARLDELTAGRIPWLGTPGRRGAT